MKKKVELTFLDRLLVKMLRGRYLTDEPRFKMILHDATNAKLHVHKNPVKKVYNQNAEYKKVGE